MYAQHCTGTQPADRYTHCCRCDGRTTASNSRKYDDNKRVHHKCYVAIVREKKVECGAVVSVATTAATAAAATATPASAATTESVIVATVSTSQHEDIQMKSSECITKQVSERDRKAYRQSEFHIFIADIGVVPTVPQLRTVKHRPVIRLSSRLFMPALSTRRTTFIKERMICSMIVCVL